ncbi:MAG: response regulator [Nitrospirae bacterium]|nr:MAG: response regulator [Nitrospirota bacterium]
MEEIRILVVEDDEDDFVIVKELFEDITLWKAQIDWADSYDSAIERIKDSSYDIFIFDNHLGEKTGLELLRLVKEFGLNVPVIILTGQDDIDVDIKAMKLGASDYLVKGEITPELLERSIRYSIAQKRTEAEKDKLIKQLQEAMKEIKTLSGLIPICASCKKIRDDSGYWKQVEQYIEEHSQAEFSHGLCPDCAKKLYPGYYKERGERDKDC